MTKNELNSKITAAYNKIIKPYLDDDGEMLNNAICKGKDIDSMSNAEIISSLLVFSMKLNQEALQEILEDVLLNDK